jgi:8-oxo-dGTP pyrophosphatase MutT (NUDIX family)
LPNSHRPADPTADNPGGADAAPAARAPKRAVRPRDAASLILWRAGRNGPEVLMGLRHARHRFMPSVLVFPGGGVDRGDHRAPAASELRPEARAMLERRATPARARALGVAAARELLEETGLVLGERRGDAVAPDLAALEYLCRAVTPPTRPIRFNARFLIAPAEAARGQLAGSGELETLGWYGIEQALSHRLAAITERVLIEFRAWLPRTPEQRAAEPMIVFRGNDNRMLES